jgi:hypothetical protein
MWPYIEYYTTLRKVTQENEGLQIQDVSLVVARHEETYKDDCDLGRHCERGVSRSKQGGYSKRVF